MVHGAFETHQQSSERDVDHPVVRPSSHLVFVLLLALEDLPVHHVVVLLEQRVLVIVVRTVKTFTVITMNVLCQPKEEQGILLNWIDLCIDVQFQLKVINIRFPLDSLD